ncbi:aconitate hydratase AcnA [Hyphomicrobium sulfonivorans]|uniref:aconitate hydratase AcnA n=1 Tax=Hyphomicrobium sulfonivorans TaxID=121290 RepID=UPI00156EF153|nr:aconitate hydratase AcnA [Hyphomicrobium sulfonivorans]MBI1648471.1 aconitate hydratase AcnA [Hyphomicrobium sulfonivorans]NSL70991.1 aconitate hydratase AcnA [Hyphomicrobium sulfonivorans]
MSDVQPISLDSFKCRRTISAGGKTYTYYSLPEAEKNGLAGISRLPFSMRVLLENLLRHEDGRTVTKADIEAVAAWLNDKGKAGKEIGFRPARVLMQDFTGVPAVVDLAAMRDGMKSLGGDAQKINPLVPVDLVIDHSVIVDEFGSPQAFAQNVELEYRRNVERYNFLKWGQGAFDNFRVVPPGTGICHQVNLEFLAQTVWTRELPDGTILAYPDTLVGTDSHTTMVNGLAVLGWGVGGIEAEAAMLGQAQSMLLPEVIGFKLTGKVNEGVTATDLVLTVTQMLRKKGVVGKFVEFYGPGLDTMPLADRATIANMAPEYGATCGFFPIDGETLNYLRISGRESGRIELVEEYAKAQNMYRIAGSEDPVFTDTLELDLSTVVPSMAGPKRPEGRIALPDVAPGFATALAGEYKKTGDTSARFPVKGRDFDIGHGDVVITAITSCTNTSNPSVLIAAGLLAKKAVEKGLTAKPWVKTSLAPGSQVVSAYLEKAGLQPYLDKVGFNLVGFGCTTCIGNSGPLAPEISATINENGIVAAAVLSGNRNFEGRVSPDVQANYLASPPLVVAYALAGTVAKDLTVEPIGIGSDGEPVYLRDIWPSSQEIHRFIAENITRELFLERYADVFNGDASWRAIDTAGGETYTWDDDSTYVRNPPYFEGISKDPRPISDIKGARILGLFGDKITTDHISPAGSIKPSSPAGEYLSSHDVAVADFNQYGTRRGNHEVMMRGTFANIRIKNFMLRDADGNVKEGGNTVHYPSGQQMSIYDAAMRYRDENVPLVVFAGVEYGNGSSRDWAAKGTNLLGVRAVISQSFERIHRSNLVGMGIVPFVFEEGTSWETLGLKGDEIVSIPGLTTIKPRQKMEAEITSADGTVRKVPIICRIDTQDEIEYFRNGGILHYVLRNLAAA